MVAVSNIAFSGHLGFALNLDHILSKSSKSSLLKQIFKKQKPGTRCLHMKLCTATKFKHFLKINLQNFHFFGKGELHFFAQMTLVLF